MRRPYTHELIRPEPTPFGSGYSAQLFFGVTGVIQVAGDANVQPGDEAGWNAMEQG